MSIFDYICHRDAERSFSFKGYQFPVCARCTGMYIAYFSFWIMAFFQKFYFSFLLFLLSFLLILPAGLDGITQKYKLRESNNVLRLITGLLCGFGVGIFAKNLYYMLIIFSIF